MIYNKCEMEKIVLIDPALVERCDELRIVSGYATPSMAMDHLYELHKLGVKVNIKLMIGMTSTDGLSEINHKGFLELVKKFDDLSCSYIKKDNAACHSKVYLWLKSGEPIIAFLGSANYTQNAFKGSQREAMGSCDVEFAETYIDSFSNEVVSCTSPDIDKFVNILSPEEYKNMFESKHVRFDKYKHLELDESVFLPLIMSNGKIHLRGGLNWGQREGRNPNQAYLPIPASIRKNGFFPPKKIHFTVETDDGHTMICVVSQQGDKAIETPFDNSQLGLYFRNRLGLKSGQFVNLDDLIKYGRTNVEFIKIDEETYFMDFST